jgi:hypothetical protein
MGRLSIRIFTYIAPKKGFIDGLKRGRKCLARSLYGRLEAPHDLDLGNQAADGASSPSCELSAAAPNTVSKRCLSFQNGRLRFTPGKRLLRQGVRTDLCYLRFVGGFSETEPLQSEFL